MIKIIKSTFAPVPLGTRGLTHHNLMVKHYQTDPAACLVIKSTLIEANSSIYGDYRVKALLQAEQHQKCCYCEDVVKSNAFGDVEHFRPKGAYQEIPNGPLMRPGYFWLAYDWNNLYFSCSPCNQKYKRNYFPLIPNSNARAIIGQVVNRNQVVNEKPLLIDLATEDPETHLTFEDDVIKARDISGYPSQRGLACIKAYGLDRIDLTEVRREHLDKFKRDLLLAAIYEVKANVEEIPQLVQLYGPKTEIIARLQQAYNYTQNAAKDSGRFAAMIRAVRPNLPRV